MFGTEPIEAIKLGYYLNQSFDATPGNLEASFRVIYLIWVIGI